MDGEWVGKDRVVPGVYFRVDGADLETGQDTFLILRAASSEEAEELARKQGMLIASVRPATAADWSSRPDAAGLRPLAAMVAESRAAAATHTINAKPDHLTPNQSGSAIAPPLGRSVFADGKIGGAAESKPPVRTPPVRIPPPKILRAQTSTITPPKPPSKPPTPATPVARIPSAPIVPPVPEPNPQADTPAVADEPPQTSVHVEPVAKKATEVAPVPAPAKTDSPPIEEPKVWNQAAALVAGSVNLAPPKKVADAPAPRVETPPQQTSSAAESHAAEFVQPTFDFDELSRVADEDVADRSSGSAKADPTGGVSHSVGIPISHEAAAPAPVTHLDEPATFQAPIAEPSPMALPAAQPVPMPAAAPNAPAAHTYAPQPAAVHRHTGEGRPGGWLAPLILAPLGFVSLAGGIIVLALNAGHVEAADATEVNKLDLHIQSLTQTFLGGTLLLGGLLLFVTAAQVYLAGLLRAARRG